MTLEDTKRILVGEWVSVTPEVRPARPGILTER